MTSLASTKGPSVTESLPSATRTCAPDASGISPPLSSIRPALISRSASLPIASSRACVGPTCGCGLVTIYMKRIGWLLVGRAAAGMAAEIGSHEETTNEAGPNRQDTGKIDVGGRRPLPLLPQQDQGVGAVGHQPPLRIVVGFEMPDLAAVGHQEDLPVLQPPLRRREGGDGGIAFRLQEHLEIVVAGVVVGQRQAADRVAVAAYHRPVADHLILRLGERAGGGKILQDVDALIGADALENAFLDLGEVEHRLAARVLEPNDIEPLDAPGLDVLGKRQI